MLEKEILGRIGDLYWKIRNEEDEDKKKSMQEEYDDLEGRYDRNEYAIPLEINKNGNRVVRGFIGDGSRYIFDGSLKEDWQQYDTDQDASYFGVWVNKKMRHIITYAEGDVTRVICYSDENFNKQIESMNSFYGEGKEFVTLDMEDGKRTEYRQERSKFLIS